VRKICLVPSPRTTGNVPTKKSATRKRPLCLAPSAPAKWCFAQATLGKILQPRLLTTCLLTKRNFVSLDGGPVRSDDFPRRSWRTVPAIQSICISVPRAGPPGGVLLTPRVRRRFPPSRGGGGKVSRRKIKMWPKVILTANLPALLKHDFSSQKFPLATSPVPFDDPHSLLPASRVFRSNADMPCKPSRGVWER